MSKIQPVVTGRKNTIQEERTYDVLSIQERKLQRIRKIQRIRVYRGRILKLWYQNINYKIVKKNLSASKPSEHSYSQCVCVFFSFILDIKFVGRTSRGHTGGRSHRISHPPSFRGAWLNFSREKDSAISFPRRPRSRILCTGDLIVLHPLGIFVFVF